MKIEMILSKLQDLSAKLKKKGSKSLVVMVEGVIMVILGIILIFRIVGGSSSELTSAANNISGSGLPFASFMASNGIVLMAFMISIVIAILTLAFKMKGK